MSRCFYIVPLRYFNSFFFCLFMYLLGAASDMEASNKIAHAMVSMYGMSDKVRLGDTTCCLD